MEFNFQFWMLFVSADSWGFKKIMELTKNRHNKDQNMQKCLNYGPGSPLVVKIKNWCSLKIKEHFVFFKENKEQLPSLVICWTMIFRF